MKIEIKISGADLPAGVLEQVLALAQSCWSKDAVITDNTLSATLDVDTMPVFGNGVAKIADNYGIVSPFI